MAAHSDFKDIYQLFLKRTKQRYDLVSKLKIGTPGNVNVELLTQYDKYFVEDDSQVCERIFKSNLPQKLISRGKVGVASIITFPSGVLVLKEIRNSPPPKEGELTIRTHRLIDIPGAKYMNPALSYWILKDAQKKALRYAFIASPTDYINQTLIHLFLNMILGDNPNYLHQYDSFWCSESGYNLTEKADLSLHDYLNKVKSFTPSLGDEIIRQILSPLSLLKQAKYSFVHADLKTKNIFVVSGRGTDGDIFKIADFDKSSITWNGVRFYNGSNDIIRQTTYKKIGWELEEHDKFTWYVPSTTLPLQVYTMHSPFGFYLSYDIYTLFLSLISTRSFQDYYFDCIKEVRGVDDSFFRIFKSLFLPEDFIALQYKYFSSRDTMNKFESLTYINQVISTNKIRLIYDADYIYEYFGVEPPIKPDESEELTFVKSNSGYICTSQCNKTCETPKYTGAKTMSFFGGNKVYDWDNCSP